VTFSREWDEIYRASLHLSKWPWSDLVSYVCRYAKPADGYGRVLELGCGAGANIPFFLELGVDYRAIDGSAMIVSRLHETFPELKDRIVVGDFTGAIPFEGRFDLVVDRVSLAHNTTDAIRRTLGIVIERLRPGGKLIGIDWFSSADQAAETGIALDAHTRTNLPASSHLAGTGAVHFSDRDHLVNLLAGSGFRIDRLEHKQNDVLIPLSGGRFAWWNFVATKP
jgi:SAM-dependent methyltransferase